MCVHEDVCMWVWVPGVQKKTSLDPMELELQTHVSSGIQIFLSVKEVWKSWVLGYQTYDLSSGASVLSELVSVLFLSTAVLEVTSKS